MKDKVSKIVLRYSNGGEIRCMMVLKDGTELEVPAPGKEMSCQKKKIFSKK